ncbi:MAG: hypothetical protein QM784_31705 [Polyangiaceae bacterium]
MQESTAERWQFVLVLAFLGFVIAGVYWANRNPSESTPSLGQSSQSSLASPASKSGAKTKLNRSKLARGVASASEKTSTTTTRPQDPDRFEGCTPSPERRTEAPPSRDSIASLSEVLSAFDDSKAHAKRAIETIERVQKTSDGAHSALLESYRSYFLRILGDRTASDQSLERARAQFPVEACNLSLPNIDPRRREPTIRVNLVALRLALETTWSHETAALLPCGLFRVHPNDAGDAFGVLWGNERDGIAASMKRSCITRLLDGAPSQLAKATVAARDVVCAEMTGVLRGPSGPLEDVLEIASCDFLDDVVLSPERWARDGESQVKRMLDEVTQQDPVLTSRLHRYQRIVVERAKPLGDAIEFMLDSAGHDASPADCRRRARQAAYEGLAARLSALRHDEKTNP